MRARITAAWIVSVCATSGAFAGDAPNLSLVGECPGPITFNVTSTLPFAEIVLMRANGEGSASMPTGCVGTPLGLASGSLKLQTLLDSDVYGNASITADIPPVACGNVYFQAIDLGTCLTTSAVPAPVPDPPETGFTGDPGPDLTSEGWAQCAGTTDRFTTGDEFYALCEGYSQIRFACSIADDSTAEYISKGFPLAGRTLSDDVCDDWRGAVNSPYEGANHILSVDESDPDCGQFDVFYDMYVDFESPQWGCAGSINTDVGGGHIWAYVR